MRRKSIHLFLAFLLISCIISLELVDFAEAIDIKNTSHIYIGGAPTSSSSYPIFPAISGVLSEKLGVEVSVEATGGGTDNIALVQADKIHMGISGNHSVYQAIKGEKIFKGQVHDKLRGWFTVYDAVNHLVVKKDSPIKTLEDLKGKRISVQIKGGAAEKMLEQPFAEIGLPRTAFKPYFLSHRDALEGLQVGILDAANLSGGLPMAALLEFIDAMPFRLISLPKDKVQYIYTRYPYYSPVTIPANTYKGVPEARTFCWASIMFVHRDIPEDFMYKATKAIWENLDRLQTATAEAQITPETLVRGVANVTPMHPGAEKYYRERGFLK